MAYSTITLYKGCVIDPDDNFVVENVDKYLSTLQSLTFDDMQYQKNVTDLQMSIRLPINQSELSTAFKFDESINYVIIKNSDDEKEYCFFVVSRRWLSSSAIEYRLIADVLNTYKLNVDYSFNKKTMIEREHRDRIARNPYIIAHGNTRNQYNGVTWEIKTDGTRNKYYNGIFSVTPPDAGIVRIAHAVAPGEPVKFTYDLTTHNSGTFYIEYEFNAAPTSLLLIFTWSTYLSEYYRIIDDIPESSTAPLYHDATNDVAIVEPNNTSWNLLYMSRDLYDQKDPDAFQLNNPIDCYLFPEDPQKIKIYGGAGVLTPEFFESGKKYTFFPQNVHYRNPLTGADLYFVGNYDFILKSNGNQIARVTAQDEYNNAYYISVENVDNKLTIRQYAYLDYPTTTGILRETISNLDRISFSTTYDVVYYDGASDKLSDISGNYVVKNIGRGVEVVQELASINDVDRTDTRILKIIKLPYPPTDITGDTMLTINNDNWHYNPDKKALKLDDISSTFKHVLDTYVNPLNVLLVDLPAEPLTRKRDDSFESKLYHSDFLSQKFVYDSFGLNIELERVNVSEYLKRGKFEIEFIPTSTINSRFMFKFADYRQKKASDDYPDQFIVSRNNELTLYNSPYINYIRNGLNYDQKTKNIALLQNIIGLASGSVNQGLTLYQLGQRDPATGLGVPLASAGLSIAGGITNTIINMVNAERAIEQKLRDASLQRVNVAGSDDVDLLTAYSGNRLKLCKYVVSNSIRKLYADLFYYCGYMTHYQGVPATKTRYWFNFVKCKAVFDNVAPFDEAIKNELIRRYADGVTLLHEHDGVYDFDQKFENWEISIIGIGG